MNRAIGVAFFRVDQLVAEIGPIELHTEFAVFALGGVGVGFGDIFTVLQVLRPEFVEAALPGAGSEHGKMKEADIPGAEYLLEDFRLGGGGQVQGALAHPVAHVVQAGSGNRGVGQNARFQRLAGDRFPALNGAPVMASQMKPTAGDQGIYHREQVSGQQLHAVVRLCPGGLGGACATHIIEDHKVVLGQLLSHRLPHAVVVRVAVHQHHGRLFGIAECIGLE